MVAFYNKADQELYKDYQYLPQEKYRLGLNLPKTEQDTSSINTNFGLPATNAFTGSNQNNYYTGTTGSLVSGFDQAIAERQKRLEELNRPLAEAQFPSFPGARTFPGAPDAPAFDANKMYNKAAAAKAKGELYKGFTAVRNPDEVMDYANEALMDYQEKARTGQLGPSYIPAEKPTIGRRISDFFYDNVPGFSKPQSARDILESGYTGTGSGPGLMAAILSKMDRYSTLPRADQAFISSRMGYTGPTIFGSNTTGLPTDPFGINTRSAFGNYAEYTKNRAKELNESIDKSKANWQNKYGSLNNTNQFGKTWSEMNKLNLTMQDFYTKGAADLEKTKEEEYQNRIDKFVKNYKRPGVKKMFDDAYDGTNIHGGDNKSGSTTTNTGSGDGFTGSGDFSNIDNSGKNFGPYSSGSGGVQTNMGSGFTSKDDAREQYGRKDGGRIGYFYGGLASIL